MTKAIATKAFRYALDGVKPTLFAVGDTLDVPQRQFNSLETEGLIRPVYDEAVIAPVAPIVEPDAAAAVTESPKRGRRKGRGSFRDGDSGLVS